MIALNWLLFANICLIVIAYAHVAGRSDSIYSRYLVASYVLGVLFYLMLPAGLKLLFGSQVINLTHTTGMDGGDALLSKALLASLVCVGFSFIGFFIVGGASNRLSLVKVPISGFINATLARFFLCATGIGSTLLIMSAISGGLVVHGQRGQGLSLLSLTLINTILPITMAFSLDGFKHKVSVMMAVLGVFCLLAINSLLIDGSRRGTAFFFVFILLPLFVRLGILRLRSAAVLTVSMVCGVVMYGMMRKSLPEIIANRDWSSIRFDGLWQSIDYILVNADFAVVFDALIGVLSKVPGEVNYLYGATLSKLFVFPIPRSLWAEKPESISVVVGDRIFSSEASFNPTLVGELYFNLGWIGVGFGGLLAGMLLAVIASMVQRVEAGKNLSSLVFSGFCSMAMFNLWRGYTFEVIFGLVMFVFFFSGARIILMERFWVVRRGTS